jgi:hypothetical protein
MAASAYTLRPLFHYFDPAFSHGTRRYSTKLGTSWGDYLQHKENRTPCIGVGDSSPEAPDPNRGILLRPDLRMATSSVMAGSRCPFGDSDQDRLQGGIQVHRTFEIRRGDDDLIRSEIRSERGRPWQGPQSSCSFVSTV